MRDNIDCFCVFHGSYCPRVTVGQADRGNGAVTFDETAVAMKCCHRRNCVHGRRKGAGGPYPTGFEIRSFC